MNSKLNIGLFGFGVVGRGLYDVIKHVQTTRIEISKIVVKDRFKKRLIDSDIFSFCHNDILHDNNINLVVELIDNPTESYKIVSSALKNGKNVVSGNKKMIAENLPELIQLQKTFNVSLLYDASACGSIPVIRNLEEYYDNDLLTKITGILNGSSNYILSSLFNSSQIYSEALKEAQEKGFAESNPTFDVDGFDSLYKLVILTLHGFGVYINPSDIFRIGISNINNKDIEYAKEKGCKIKLVGEVYKISKDQLSVYVIPRLVNQSKYIYNVEQEYNGVVIKGEFYDKQFMFGKGAGGNPTGSAVLSDITALSYNYKYEYKKLEYFNPPVYNTNNYLVIYLRYSDTNELKHFNFTEIYEKHNGNSFNYVTGKIKLSSLIAIKDIILSLDVFIALTNNNYE